MKYFTINIFLFLCQILHLLHLLSSSLQLQLQHVLIVTHTEMPVWEGSTYKHTHAYPLFRHDDFCIGKRFQIFIYTAKMVTRIGGVVCLFKREKASSRNAHFVQEKLLSVYIAGFIFQISQEEVYWFWDCFISWEPLHLKGHRGLLVNSLAKT